ncbi:E3 ubiquitin-protein ligase TRIM41-like [Platysternon megacephalum]|uniref:E3 ubiquitin-protein ligase TRIM41-like n=1 Tax=Platysternon megacephalum TaxID=55544 RepID=A0A4D9DKC3_9SAUR|nr:E3 ubiquitin-protein ligase TRIM41-like [Platysternon megacephalum]
MRKTLVSTLVLILVPSGTVEAKVSQPAALSFLAGGRADLPCNHSVAGYDSVIWYYQSHGAAPRAVISGYNSAETSERFELSIDPSSRSAPLRITKVNGKDDYTPIEETYGDSVSQTEGSRIISQGDPVLLNCSYKTSFTAFPFWYVHYPTGPPRLFLRDTGKEEGDMGIAKGFSATHDEQKKTFHLWKPSSELSDSATYYCAASDTVTRTGRGAAQKPRRVCAEQRRCELWGLGETLCFLLCPNPELNHLMNDGECHESPIKVKPGKTRTHPASPEQLRHPAEASEPSSRAVAGCCAVSTVGRQRRRAAPQRKRVDLYFKDIFPHFSSRLGKAEKLLSAAWEQGSSSPEPLKMFLTWVSVVAIFSTLEQTYGNSVTQTEGTVTVPEGKPVLLNCTYKTSGSPVPFWYVQYPHEAPRLLLAEYEATDEEERKRRRGFSAKHERNPISFHLNKNSSEVSDSAVYFCALGDTVTETHRGAAQNPTEWLIT